MADYRLPDVAVGPVKIPFGVLLDALYDAVVNGRVPGCELSGYNAGRLVEAGHTLFRLVEEDERRRKAVNP